MFQRAGVGRGGGQEVFSQEEERNSEKNIIPETGERRRGRVAKKNSSGLIASLYRSSYQRL